MKRPRVVVIGAGFGGIAAAHELARDPVDITIVDRNNFHTFQPLLYQVATAGLNSADVAFPVRAIFRRQPNVTFRKASVQGVDWERATLAVDEGSDIGFDHLVVAAGATTNTFGVDGAEHALPLYSLRDAVALRNHVLSRFELAASQPDAVVDGQLTFVVVGGGPTGVEVAGALIELFHQVLRKDFRSLDISRTVVVLVEMRDDLLGSFHPSSRRHARETLASRGVDVRTGAVVDRITPAALHLRSGVVIATETVVWAAGVKADSLASVLDVEVGAGGRIVVGSDLTIPGHTGAYAVGDIAEIPGRNGALPQVAQVAMQTGRHAARQIRASLEGTSLRSFRYRDKGTMATIGKNKAIVEAGKLKLTGFIAWLAWLFIHVLTLIGFRNKLGVLSGWFWAYLTRERSARLITGDADELKNALKFLEAEPIDKAPKKIVRKPVKVKKHT